MKFVVSLLLIAFLSFVACLYFPWWSIAIVAFLVSLLIPQGPGKAFLTGFIALFLLWGGLSFWLSMRNEHILAHKMSVVILKVDNPYFLILATAVIGALAAGLGALTGSFCRTSHRRNP
jgi:hypothetical protein